MKKILREDIEYVIHSEEDGTIIGPLSKVHAHKDGVRINLTHYSTWSMIYNPKLNKYGLQLKTPKVYDKNQKPMWDMSVAGHNCYDKINGEYTPLMFEENLVKETDEEIGLTLEMFNSLNEFLEQSKGFDGTIGYIFERFLHKDNRNNEFVGAGFILTTEEKLEFKDKEVMEFRWLSPEELNKYIKEDSDFYSALPLMFEKAEKFRKKYLNN